MLKISYQRYLDQILGGWIGKSMGGTIGARFEGYKGWIDLAPEEMFPPEIPPNDDLDLQVLWLKVLEEKGLALTSDDLASAWLQHCWYPFNEYGIFRRNWRLGIRPPESGSFTNQFWETGMGCPIRAEIWGYVFPGAPDLAAAYAYKDGILDHTEQSVGGEMMFAAMSSMAFFISDVERLAEISLHYLPKNTPVERLTRAAFQAYKEGLTLREAHTRLMMLDGLPEACDAQINVPFTFLGLLYGQDDLQETLLSSLRCGYDTDCTLATAGALIGQILGASQIPTDLKEQIGDQLVMGIDYHRDEMTLSALARDTARIGVLFNAEQTNIDITDAPTFVPLPIFDQSSLCLHVEYEGLPAAAPGDAVNVTVSVKGDTHNAPNLTIETPPGWVAVPQTIPLNGTDQQIPVTFHAPRDTERLPFSNMMQLTAQPAQGDSIHYKFGIAGTGLWRFLGAYYNPLPDENDPVQKWRDFNHHFVSLDAPYLPEPDVDVASLYKEWSVKLGQPAFVASYEHEIDLSQLIGLRGPYCAYLSRTVYSPVQQNVYLVIGNTDSYRIYLNNTRVAEVDEYIWWTPFNNAHPVTLREGENHILVKLLKRGDDFKFTFGFRENTAEKFNYNDWVINLSDGARL